MCKSLEHFLGERRSFALVFGFELSEKVIGELRDIFAAFAERR